MKAKYENGTLSVEVCTAGLELHAVFLPGFCASPYWELALCGRIVISVQRWCTSACIAACSRALLDLRACNKAPCGVTRSHNDEHGASAASLLAA